MMPSLPFPLTWHWRQPVGVGLLLAWMVGHMIGCAARDTPRPNTARKSEHASVTVERSDFNQLFEDWTQMLGLRDPLARGLIIPASGVCCAAQKTVICTIPCLSDSQTHGGRLARFVQASPATH